MQVLDQEVTEQEVVQMADNMVAGATQMGSIGYDLLLSSRDTLKCTLHELFKLVEKQQ